MFNFCCNAGDIVIYLKVVGLSDDNLMFLSDMIDKFMKPAKVEQSKRIGVAEGKFVVPDDFDACNDEIAEMFGVK